MGGWCILILVLAMAMGKGRGADNHTKYVGSHLTQAGHRGVWLRHIPSTVQNGHAKPKIGDKSTKKPKRKSLKPSNKSKFLVTWLPYLANNITVSANNNYALQDTNVVISVKQSHDSKLSTDRPIKTVLLSSKYKSPTA